MRPGPRVQVAIELLDKIWSVGTPADRLLKGYFKDNRYIGSKDRRAVTDYVYGVLRHQGLLTYAIGEAEASSRNLMLAYLKLVENLNQDEVQALFSGDQYSPDSLTGIEIDLLDKAAVGEEAPAWALANFPEWLTPELERRFGDDVVEELSSMLDRAPLDLRVNTLVGDKAQAMKRLAGSDFAVEDGTYSWMALRLEERGRLVDHPTYKQGLIEIQDEGAQIASLLVAPEQKMQVVDYCAGAGGKTLALSALMNNNGQIFAFDTVPQRLDQLKQRAKRAKAKNIQPKVIGEDGSGVPEDLMGKADRVLLDVPCSNTGTWRRNPENRFKLTPEKLQATLDTQAAILDRAADLVKPGGWLVYATCSMLPAENEDQVMSFLERRDDFAVIPVSYVWEDKLRGDCPVDAETPFLQLTPARHGVDGFFVALLQRTEPNHD